MTGWRLVADVGGTNVRFGRAAGDGAIRLKRNALVSAFPSFVDAGRAYLRECGGEGLTSIAIGAAGPVENGRVKLTNAPWTIDAAEVSAAFGGVPVILVNDLEAAAMSLPFLDTGALSWLGNGRLPDASARRLALNVGTGFGAATLIPLASGWVTGPGEAGHMSLHGVAGAACVEDVLSGRGVTALYRQLGGSTVPSAQAIFQMKATDATAREICALFSDILGRVAGDLVLATAAWGGVYLFGSVAAGWFASADEGRFRAAFEDKGAMSARMRRVGVALVTHDDPALVGLAHVPLADQAGEKAPSALAV